MPRAVSLHTAVGRYTAALAEPGDENAVHGPLVALALYLARLLDAGPDEKAIAPLAKELRATLTALAPEEADDDDMFARLERDLSTPMGDRPD